MDVDPETDAKSKEEKEDAEDKAPANLWENFLSNAAKGAITHEEATVIVCGDAGCPVANLLHGMDASTGKGRNLQDQLPYFLNYRYAKAHNEVDDALHLHTWAVHNVNHSDQIPTVVPEAHIKAGRLAYILCLDASNPTTLKDQFERWSSFIEKTQATVLKKVGDKVAQELRDTLSRRLQFFTAGDEDPEEDQLLTKEEQQQLAVDSTNPKRNVGAQITVVVTNTEQFTKNFPELSNANEMFELALLFLRRWGLEFGASIFTFSNRVQAANIKTYIDSVANGPKHTLEPQVGNVSLSELKEELFFLPAGFDSETLLENSNLKKHKKSFTELFPKKEATKQHKKPVYKQQAEKDDQRYLKILRFEMERAMHRPQAPAVLNPPSKPKPPGGQIKVREFFNNLLLDNGKPSGTGRPVSSKGQGTASKSLGSRSRPGGGRKDYKKDYNKDAYAALKLINE